MANITVFDRIKKLADRRGKKIVDVESDLDFSKNYLYKWKKSTPSSDKLAKVADYFNVSVDYLLGRENDGNKTADIADEDTVFTYEGRRIPPEDLEYMKRLLRGGK